jgi:hypothetical protein
VLLKVRDGLWNPAIYVGDLVAGLFAEAAFTPLETDLAAGIEAVVELRILALGTGFPLVVGGWIGVDERPGLIWGFTGSANIPIWSGRRREFRDLAESGLAAAAANVFHSHP